jgi:hypothetical protein
VGGKDGRVKPGTHLAMLPIEEILRRAAAYQRLVAALRACISAASTDKVEDFGVVSNAADDAGKLLRELGEE